MLARLLGIRPQDQRDTAVAFTTLVAMLAAHSMLETARDAMFLSHLPPEQLPVVYIAIAVLAWGVSKANQWATTRWSRRRLLSICLALGGVVTASFFAITASQEAMALGALYVWTGLLATVVVVQFWLQLGDVLDVGQAKRLFSIIAAGGLVGATLGSAGASALLEVTSARHLLLLAGSLFVFASILPLGFTPTASAPRRRRASFEGARGGLAEIKHDPYLRRLFLMVLVGAVLVTMVDFLFKAKVVAEAENQGWDLGMFFGRFYAVVNAISLLVQVVVAPRLLGAVGVNRALVVMPTLLFLGAMGFATTLALVPALLLKASDGALRHSVHRTATEILYLPLERKVRERFKGAAEALGQRGGQALASILLLGLTATTTDARAVATGLVVLAAVWLATMVGLQPFYIERFRQQLRAGQLDGDVEIPDLDLASFETLVAALSSEDDQEVEAALGMFELYGKTDLIPALILYHPSTEVVLRAFALFAESERTDVRRLTGRLLRHEDPTIRAAALSTYASGGAEAEETLR
ncbi:MAG: MFS transporter, partial [Myxococcota bacterium]